jgi:ubiquinone/menaquinone biosynthesis C-methylase UbiE
VTENDKRFDPQKWEGLVSAEREARWNPPQFLERFHVQAGDTVLDLGCGPGFWTLPLAELVGEEGKVYALDVSQEMLEALKIQQPPLQVVPLLSELPAIDLESSAADFIWAAFVYHEVEGDGLAAEMLRVIRSGGQIAILEWRPDGASESKPPSDHRVWPKEIKQALQQAGFSQVAEAWRDEDAYLITAHNGDRQ